MRFDDDYVSSELFRLTPPRGPETGDPVIVVSPDIEAGLRARASRAMAAARPTARWLGGVATGIVIAVAAALIVLWVHGG
jgi:hypothetical protein